MAVVINELKTVEVNLGDEPDDLITVGDSYAHRFRVEDVVDGSPANFTGFTPSFDIIDAAGSVILSGTVTPAVGDTTGEFLVALTAAQTTTLGEAQNAFRLRIDDGGGTIRTLFCGGFKTTPCQAQS